MKQHLNNDTRKGMNIKENNAKKHTWNTFVQKISPMLIPERGIKVGKGAKIRNRYNQITHLTQDTNGKVTNSQ